MAKVRGLPGGLVSTCVEVQLELSPENQELVELLPVVDAPLRRPSYCRSFLSFCTHHATPRGLSHRVIAFTPSYAGKALLLRQYSSYLVLLPGLVGILVL